MTTVLDTFKALVPLANPSGGEDAVRDYIRDRLQDYGLPHLHVDAAGNLFLHVPGDPRKDTLLLCAHMDSVPPCEGITWVEDTVDGVAVLRSAGRTILGADDKSGIAVILALLERLAAREPGYGEDTHHPLDVLFTTQEEVGLKGAQAFDRSQLQARMGFVLDGEGAVGTIFTAAPTHKALRFEFTGVRAHAGIAPEAGTSAITMAAHLCARLPSGRLSPEMTMNLGTIAGGDALNVVAPHAVICGEARSHDDAALATLLAEIADTCRSVEQAFPRGQIAFTPTHKYDGYALPPDSPVIEKAREAAHSVGLTPQIAQMHIGSDAHILNHGGLPTVVLGMGFHYSHSLGEYLPVSALEAVTHWLGAVIR